MNYLSVQQYLDYERKLYVNNDHEVQDGKEVL